MGSRRADAHDRVEIHDSRMEERNSLQAHGFDRRKQATCRKERSYLVALSVHIALSLLTPHPMEGSAPSSYPRDMLDDVRFEANRT